MYEQNIAVLERNIERAKTASDEIEDEGPEGCI